MGSPTSATTENPELPSRRPGGTGSKGTPPAADTDDAFVDAASSYERPSRSSWPSEVPPTGVLTGVLGEMAFYYEACWLHHRSAQRRVK
jgi:hypothetical protein